MSRKLLIMLLVGVLLILVLLFSIFVINKEPRDTSNLKQPISSNVSNTLVPNKNIEGSTNKAPNVPTTEKVVVVQPENLHVGKLTAVEPKGSSMLIRLNPREGDTKSEVTYKLGLDSIVFDSDTGLAIQPNTLTLDASITVYKQVGAVSDAVPVRAVVQGDGAKMLEVGDAGLSSIASISNNVLLSLTKETLVFNALTGEPFDITFLKEKDIVFFYGVEKSNPTDKVTGQDAPKIPVNIPETKDLQSLNEPLVTEYIVSELSVYPN